MTQDWRLKPERGVAGSRAAVVEGVAVSRVRKKRSARASEAAVGTGLEGARVEEAVGFESARGKVGRSKAGGTLSLIMRAGRGVDISAFDRLGSSQSNGGCGGRT